MNPIYQLHLDNQSRSKTDLCRVSNEGAGALQASLYLYDVISADWGISATQVIAAIEQAQRAGDITVLNLYINSPGGDVFEARAIMAALQRFPGQTVAHIDALCASAATSIALACSEVNMSAGALFMIHNASGAVWGDKTAMRDTADLLQKVELAIVNDYTRKTQKTPEDISAMMDAETWMTAEEALAHGFIDQITPQRAADKSGQPSNTASQWNLSVYPKAPQVQQNSMPPESPAPPEPPALPQPEDAMTTTHENLDKPEPLEQTGQAQAHVNRVRLLELL
jgi:ATP-dependent Clp protease protease subunit